VPVLEPEVHDFENEPKHGRNKGIEKKSPGLVKKE
jgi:hypothetical protein